MSQAKICCSFLLNIVFFTRLYSTLFTLHCTLYSTLCFQLISYLTNNAITLSLSFPIAASEDPVLFSCSGNLKKPGKLTSKKSIFFCIERKFLVPLSFPWKGKVNILLIFFQWRQEEYPPPAPHLPPPQ